MEFLEELVTNDEIMFLYELMSFFSGFILIFNVQSKQILYNISVYSICFVNAFLWGSLLLIRITCNKWLFLLGGFAGLLLILMFLKIKKESINYLFCFWTLVKIGLISFHFFINDYANETEEKLFLSVFLISLMVVGITIIVSLIFKESNGSREKRINRIQGICSLFYGSCLFAGGIYEFIYDVSASEAKFIYEKKGYINIYKALLKADWTEDGTGGFFVGLCVCAIIAGGVCLCRRKDENSKGFESSGGPEAYYGKKNNTHA